MNFEGAEIAVPLEVAQTAPNGVWQGDPRLCSPETGAALVERLAGIGARLAARVAGWKDYGRRRFRCHRCRRRFSGGRGGGGSTE